ncbi:DNA polymerase IV [Kineococcus radiotolerans]|uniref:DNA polymerase IV n=1 Tax=Kineococcus radiotolerans TaxID=131568 RepID=UPI00003A4CAE|nr:DNA polymerase IV [Kineococcus radiotolerans]
MSGQVGAEVPRVRAGRPDPTRPSVLHLDLDAFFAAVEQRDKPSLRGKPVVVGGPGGRGVVATASYEARVFGVGSAMPTARARRLCPNAAYLAGRFEAYRAVSEQVMGLAHTLSPLVEPLSLDEAFVDLSAVHDDLDVERVTGIAEGFRAEVRARTGLTVSVGVGASKLVAKIASDLRKPDALVVVPPQEQEALLAPMSVRRIPGVGAVTGDRLVRSGLRTIGDLAAADEGELVRMLGKAHGSGLLAFARGIDPRPVVPEREAKSVSAEETFSTDLTDRADLTERIRRMADRVAVRLGKAGLSGRTITIKVRRYDFSTLNRSRTLPHATSSAKEVALHAGELLDGVDVADGVRLLGVGVSGLSEYSQIDLLAEIEDPLPPVEDVEEPAGLVEGGSPHPYGPPASPGWRPGQDVVHAGFGPGWVQGSGVGRVTVRFEGPHTPPGRVRTFRDDDPDLTACGPPAYLPGDA